VGTVWANQLPRDFCSPNLSTVESSQGNRGGFSRGEMLKALAIAAKRSKRKLRRRLIYCLTGK
jgi:hypothetical protein